MNIESRWFLIGLIGVFGILTIFMGVQFITPLMLGIVLAVLMVPVYTRLLKTLRGRGNLAALLSVFLVLLIIVIPITAVFVLITQEAINLFARAQEYASAHTLKGIFGSIAPLLEKLHIPLEFNASLQNELADGLRKTIEWHQES